MKIEKMSALENVYALLLRATARFIQLIRLGAIHL